MNLTHLPRKKVTLLIMAISSLLLVGGMAWFIQSLTVKANFPDISSAESRYPNIVNSRIDTCSLCHLGSPPNLNPYGAAYKAAGRSPGALAAIEPLDSDSDGWTNLQEIMALYFPGDASDHPAGATATSVPPTPTRTSPPPTATRTPTSPPPTATKTSVPPTPTNTATNPPPTATRTSIPPTATNTSVPPTATQAPTNLPPTATNTAVPPTATNTVVVPTSTNTAPPPPTATHTAPPPPTATPTAPPPPTATRTSPPPPTATRTLPPPPTATHTAAPPLPTSTEVATHVPTVAFTPTSTVAAEEPTDDDGEVGINSRPPRRPTPTRRPSPTPPCGYYREDGGALSQGSSPNFSGSDGDRGSIYRRCNPRTEDAGNGFSQFATRVSDFFGQLFSFFH